MGKKKTATGLGRTLIKSRFGQNKTDGNSFLHTSELNDGYDWGRLNLQSVTEQNNLEEFLATAELAGTEFTAEKLNVKFISKNSSGLPQGEELARITGLHKQHEDLLRIPRRPPWTPEMSASLLDQNEKQAFLEWRRTLSVLQDVEGLVMTPYEKNLDFWRQLWRVIERSDVVVQIVDARNPLLAPSDVVVQIVDARNPLLFYCGDLETYVGEVGKDKMCVMLINKADYLDDYQRDMWAEYFNKKGIRVAFWSAVNETKRQEAEKAEQEQAILTEAMEDDEDESSSSDDDDDDADDEGDMEEEDTEDKDKNSVENEELDSVKCDKELEEDTKCDKCDKLAEKTDVESVSDKAVQDTDKEGADLASGGAVGGTGDGRGDVGVGCEIETNSEPASGDKIVNTGHVHSGPEIVEYLRAIHSGKKVQEGLTTIGMVGYPNVGKSSTINAILKMKKVPVSATPGRTKHFQTLFVDSSLMLCDCPGLVFPSFVTTKADLIVNGILPIDQMRDCIPPSSLICSRIPRSILETTYGIMIPKPVEGEDPSRPPTAHELLNSYGAMRGYMTARGQPDGPRSSRNILKDYVNGKLLYCHPPSDVEVDQFNNFIDIDEGTEGDVGTATATSSQAEVPVTSKMDEEFFRKEFSTVHQRTAKTGGNDPSSEQQKQKPWKKHNNRNKKEKMRRVYGHLDG